MPEPVIEEHYGLDVWTDQTFDSARAALCLCFRCSLFKPETPENNCRIAALLYALCRQTGIAAGVSRCPVFTKEE